jgi:FMN phosphatase YigB (HAD superfamily)
MDLRGVIFDLGGTIAVDRPLEAWKREHLAHLIRYVPQPEPWMIELISDQFSWYQTTDAVQPTRAALQRHLERRGFELTDELFRHVCGWFSPPLCDVMDVEPDAQKVLQELVSTGLPLAACCNVLWRDRDQLYEDLAAWGLASSFRVIVSSLDVGFMKPHPAMFRAALDGLGVAPHEAVMIGDRPDWDIAGAQALGLRTVWKRPKGFVGTCDPTPDAEVDSLMQLLDLIPVLPYSQLL